MENLAEPAGAPAGEGKATDPPATLADAGTGTPNAAFVDTNALADDDDAGNVVREGPHPASSAAEPSTLKIATGLLPVHEQSMRPSTSFVPSAASDWPFGTIPDKFADESTACWRASRIAARARRQRIDVNSIDEFSQL